MRDGFSRARLSRMREVMSGYVERGELPGLVTALVRGGEPHVEALGMLGQPEGRPMQRDTIFRISSLTKPIVAVAALTLVEECALRLDDPVDTWLPELADRRVLKERTGPLDETVPAARAITLRDLLTMRWGFGQFLAHPAKTPILRALVDELRGFGPPEPQQRPDPDEYMRRLGALPLMCQPGERWLYDTAYDVLGVLLARVSGRPLAQLLHERIFEPLGMKDTGFHVEPARRARLGASYEMADGALQVFDPPDGQWSAPPRLASGAGGLVSTIDDYVAFATMLRAGGKHGRARILAPSTVALITSDQLTPAQHALSGLLPGDFDAHGYGFGVAVVTRRDDAASLGQYGWDGGLGSSWRTDPEQNLIGVLLTPVAWSAPQPPDVCRDFWTLAYAAVDDA